MGRILIYAIALTQLLGGAYALRVFERLLQTGAFTAADMTAQFWYALPVAVFAVGVLGAILIYTGHAAGRWLSVLHQLALIPIYVALVPVQSTGTANAPRYDGIHYALHDGLSLSLLSITGETRTETKTPAGTSVTTRLEHRITWIYALGSHTMLENVRLNYLYYGANFLALVSMIILVFAGGWARRP